MEHPGGGRHMGRWTTNQTSVRRRTGARQAHDQDDDALEGFKAQSSAIQSSGGFIGFHSRGFQSILGYGWGRTEPQGEE